MDNIGLKKSWLIAGIGLISSVQAGVTLDGTLGPPRILPGPDYEITSNLGRQVGSNLFHSFGQFSLNTGESATFSGPKLITTIIGRITGGEVSFIDGTLRSTIPGANLYLLNPAGVIFSEHAHLDVPGSVHISTADYLRLSDGGRFDAHTPANSVLTIAPVAAFGFLNHTPAPITLNHSFLQVPEGQKLSLIGGDLALKNAYLYAPAGRINLVSVGSAGELTTSETSLELNSFSQMRDISIYHDPAITRRRLNNHTLGDLTTSGLGGGTLFIRGRNLLADGGWLLADTYGDNSGNGVNIMLTEQLSLRNGSWISAGTEGAGNGGDINLDINEMNLGEGSQISSNTFSQGDSGSIDVKSHNSVTISGTDLEGYSSGLLTGAAINSTGNAGNINLITGRLEVNKGGKISADTGGEGQGGNIDIFASTVTIQGTDPSGEIPSTISAGADSNSISRAGNIKLDVDNLTLSDGGSIITANVGKKGAGNIHIIARGALTISGTSSNGAFASGLSATSSGTDAGDITLEVGRLDLMGGGKVVSNTAGSGQGGNIEIRAVDVTIRGGKSSLQSATNSFGNAGSIILKVDHLELSEGGYISANSFMAGHGGDLDITAHDSITINGRDLVSGISSGLFSSANFIGDAGNITVNTPNLLLANGGTISASSLISTGGNINIFADHMKLFNESTVSSSVFGAEESDGGNIAINSTNLVALNGSNINAWALLGKGGNIQINAQVFLHNAVNTDAVLNASSLVTGNDGIVTVNAPQTDISGSLVTLDANYLNAAGQLSNRCGVVDQDTRSRFTIQARGALPSSPDGALVAPSRRCEPLPDSPSARAGQAIAPLVPITLTQFSGFGDL